MGFKKGWKKGRIIFLKGEILKRQDLNPALKKVAKRLKIS
jgi:hypothetical protein